MIGLECESGNVDDCDLSMTMEVLPFSCKGILMFSTESERDCGTKCDESQSRNNLTLATVHVNVSKLRPPVYTRGQYELV